MTMRFDHMRWLSAILLFVLPISGALAQRQTIEPRKITSANRLRAEEGALRLSVRTQIQSTQTLFVYFVEVRDDGSDGTRILKFERGAGVPLMGSNMIDPRPAVYRVPVGRYRPIAYALGCTDMPQTVNQVCAMNFGGAMWPTGYYRQSSPIVEVVAGQLTEGGDFIVEYNGEIHGANVDPAQGYDLRWRALSPITDAAFASLQRTPPVEAAEPFVSRIRCNARPAGISLYIPREC